MSRFAESLKRLYKSGKVSEEKLNELLSENKRRITEEDYKKITGEDYQE